MGTKLRQPLLFVNLLIGLGLLILIPAKVNAASPSQTLTISPDTVNTTVQSGAVNSQSLIIKNQGSSGYQYSVYVTPYNVLNENYAPNFTAIPSFANITSWFHFTTTGGFLTPNSTTSLSYTLNVPKNTPAGGYYAAVFVEIYAPKLSKTQSAFQINQRLGELVYLRVAGPAVQKAKVLSWQASFLQQRPATATLRLENQGNVHYVSNSDISFRDILGNTKYEYAANYVVLPHTTRLISVIWPHPPVIGLFKVNGTVTTYGIQYLTTKYILVVSMSARVIFIIIIGLLILLYIAKGIIKRSSIKSKRLSKLPNHMDKSNHSE